MSDWTGLKYWDKPQYPDLLTKFWKATSVQELQQTLFLEMRRLYSEQRAGKLLYTDNAEKYKTIKAIGAGLTNYKEEDVTYDVNLCGFRGNWRLGRVGKNLGVFGCSFTYGIGVAESDYYPTLFGKHLKSAVYNFGVPGGSFNKAVRYYSLASQFQHFDYVIFLVPHCGRLEYPFATPPDNEMHFANIIPNFSAGDRYEEALRTKVYKGLDNNYLEYDTIRNINHAVSIAKEHNTKIFFSSWDIPTYDILYNYLGENSGMLLPWFEVIEFQTQERKNLARDGEHPGPQSHLNFFNRSIPYLDENR